MTVIEVGPVLASLLQEGGGMMIFLFVVWGAIKLALGR
jgi:hypothetical protein